ncbi:hypothetical protein PYCC9005_005062 [Savitreella phatthalungensis]
MHAARTIATQTVRSALRRKCYRAFPINRSSLSPCPIHAFHTTASREFAFRWFKRPSEDQSVVDRRTWRRTLNAGRRPDSQLAEHDAELLLAVLNRPETGHRYLSFEDLLEALQLSTRQTSALHASLSAQLYSTLLTRWHEAVEGTDAETVIAHIAPTLIHHLALAGESHAALTLCAEISSKQSAASDLWVSLLQGYKDAADIDAYIKAREYMLLHAVPMTTNLLNLHLQLCDAGKLYTDAIELYNRAEVAKDTRTRKAVLDIALKTRDWSLGEKVVQDVRRHDVTDDPYDAYPALLAWLAGKGVSMEEMTQEIKTMRDADVDLSTEIMDGMLYGATLTEQWQAVEQLWDAHAADLLPSARTLSLRVAAAVMAHDLPLATQVYATSKSHALHDQLDSLSLQALLAAELAGDRSAKNNTLVDEILGTLMVRVPCPITPLSLRILVPKLIAAQGHLKLDEILRLCKQTRADWDSAAVISLIMDEVAVAKDAKAVINLHTMLRRCFAEERAFDLDVRHKLLDRLGQLGAGKQMGDLFQQFLKASAGADAPAHGRPDYTTYLLMLNAATEMRDLQLVRRVHMCLRMDVVSIGDRPGEHTAVLNRLMKAYAYCLSPSCLDVWEQLCIGGDGPDHAAVSIILDACNHMRVPQRGQHIWRTLHRTHFQFNDNNWASRIEMLTRNGLIDEAFESLDQGILLDQHAIGERTLSTLWNTAGGVRQRTDAWARENLPAVWDRLMNRD